MTSPKPTSYRIAFALLFAMIMLSTGSGCSTAPKKENQASFIAESKTALQWFETRTPGLKEQIDKSAGYVVFPGVGQWGILFTGGKFGRGLVARPNGTQEGWGAVNTGSLGLQAGVQGFKMLVVFQDEATFSKFKQNQLSGSVSGVAVVVDAGGSKTVDFSNGVAVYQGANSGLMAGVNMALDYMRYKPLDED